MKHDHHNIALFDQSAMAHTALTKIPLLQGSLLQCSPTSVLLKTSAKSISKNCLQNQKYQPSFYYNVRNGKCSADGLISRVK